MEAVWPWRLRPFGYKLAGKPGKLSAEMACIIKEMKSLRIPRKQLQAFCQRYQVRRLALFGSQARGEARPESDVDLLVTFQPEAQVGFLTLGKMRRELTEIFHRPVDLVPQEGLKPVIREAVLAEARELYAA